VVVCEVEVDTETGQVTVPRIHAELYAGKIINPRLCELQIEGATTFGLGQVLFEEVLQDTNGSITNPNLSDYMIPSFEDVPAELTVHMLEPHGVTDVHGVGETAIPPARPAIGNAISRAVGCHFLDLPITPEKVLRALNQQKLTSKR
jgi:CO/xanthine dehydrogenase Mo-binding subunit